MKKQQLVPFIFYMIFGTIGIFAEMLNLGIVYVWLGVLLGLGILYLCLPQLPRKYYLGSSFLLLGVSLLTFNIFGLISFALSVISYALFVIWLQSFENEKNKCDIAAMSSLLIAASVFILFVNFWQMVVPYGAMGIGCYYLVSQMNTKDNHEKLSIHYQKTLKKENWDLLSLYSLIALSIITAIAFSQINFIIGSYDAFFSLIIAGGVSFLLMRVYGLQGFYLPSMIGLGLLTIGLCTRFFGSALLTAGCMSLYQLFYMEWKSHISRTEMPHYIMSLLIGIIVAPLFFGQIVYYCQPLVFILVGILIYLVKQIKALIASSHYDLKMTSEVNWNVHPSPQKRRDTYLMFNDGWTLDGKNIQLPFPPQSVLSGFDGQVRDELVYEKRFMYPETFTKDRIILHFGAVDQECDVYLNDIHVGGHEGGYLPFEIDITDVLYKNDENYIKVVVKDDLSEVYPYGKQTKNRGGMWYTPVSGIWQNVWLENVCENYIQSIKMTPSFNGITVELEGDIERFEAVVEVDQYIWRTFKFEGKKGKIVIDHPKYWSCDHPFLYNVTFKAGNDEVQSYFAIRTISIKKINGVNRVCLNNKPIFMHGLLDQGYYPEGIFLPNSYQDYETEVLRMKELGFNLLRKHIKVEPEAFYYACDKHGMLVMQDFVNNGKYHFIQDTVIPTYVSQKKDDTKVSLEKETSKVFIEHSKQLVDHVYNHPCIIAYTIFNEGWGQFQSDKLYNMVKEWDATRLIDSTSGWFSQQKNDFDSHHIYFAAKALDIKTRPYLLSECGGYTMKVNDHFFSQYQSYGYGTCESKEELTDKIKDMYETMVIPYISKGLCGCIYTQVSDVEDEINGLYTYDRQVCKVNQEKMVEIAKNINEEIKKG